MKRTQIYFPYHQLRLLKKKAYEEEASLSEIIRRLIQKALEEKSFPLKKAKKQENSGDWLLSLAKEAEKLKIKGPKDLSSSIDKYLY